MSKPIIIKVDKPGERLDLYLAREIDDLSRARAQQLIKDGLITVEKAKAKQSYIVKTGDVIEVEIPLAKELTANPESLPVKILFEDENLLVVNKPRGMVVHPGPGHTGGTLVNALLYHCENLSGIGGVLRPGIVHRLDKDTSGLLMVAKNDIVHQDLSRQLKERSTRRDYVAVVWGRLSHKNLVINAPLGRDPCNRKKMAVLERGREAITNVRLLAYLKGCTLIRARLKTGRTHQIRVHLSYIGHPVVGDNLYGGKNKILNEIEWEGQALHARRLGFVYPHTGEKMQFVAPIPSDFRRLLHFLRNEKGM